MAVDGKQSFEKGRGGGGVGGGGELRLAGLSWGRTRRGVT